MTRYTAVDVHRNGRETVLATGLTLAQVLSFKPAGQTWAVTFRQEDPLAQAITELRQREQALRDLRAQAEAIGESGLADLATARIVETVRELSRYHVAS